MSVDVRIEATNAAEITAAFLRSREIVLDELETTMGTAIEAVKTETQMVMTERKVVAAGTLRSAWITRVDVDRGVGQVVGRATNPESYAIPVELGTKPHYPPLEPLINWAEQKLHLQGPDAERAARGIQRKIGRIGTPARGMAHTGLAGAADTIRAEFAECAQRIKARIAAAGGGAGGAVNPGGAA